MKSHLETNTKLSQDMKVQRRDGSRAVMFRTRHVKRDVISACFSALGLFVVKIPSVIIVNGFHWEHNYPQWTLLLKISQFHNLNQYAPEAFKGQS